MNGRLQLERLDIKFTVPAIYVTTRTAECIETVKIRWRDYEKG